MFTPLYSHELLHTPIDSPILKFLVIMAIIVFSPLVLNRLRIPNILGLILAGAIVGPNGFNLIIRDTGIVMSGTAGLLYIMFLAGLEIDMNEFVKSRKKSLVFGLLTFSIPMAMGIAAGLYLLEFSLVTSILLASMFATHTLLAYPLISKMGVKRNRAVTVTIGGTVITETLALLVLAVIVELSQGAVDALYWVKFAASVSLFAATIFIGFPIITRFFLKRITDGLYQYVFILFMLFTGAAIAELAEIEGIIGALFTGLALNRLIPHSSALMNRIDFVGNAIFIPFFLIGVGMLIDYKIFLSDFHTIYTALIMTTIAIVSKYIAALIAQKSFHYSTSERTLIFGLSNARAAATLAVVLVGYNIITGTDDSGEPIRLFSDAVLNGTIIMIFITCTVASFAAQRGAYRISMNEQIDLDKTPSGDLQKVLLPINSLDSTQELMSFTNLIVPHNNSTIVSVVSIIAQRKDEDEQLALSHKIFDRAVQCSAALDRSIETSIRYDISYTSGVLNIIRELPISDLVFAIDPEKFAKGKLLSKILDDSMKSSSVTTFMYYSCQPMETIKRYVIIIPPNAEFELGFRSWILRIWNLMRATGASALVYGNEHTIEVLKRINKAVPFSIRLEAYNQYEDVLSIKKNPHKDDGLIIVLSKKHNPSYHEAMERIPYYINTSYKHHNFILLYPYQQGSPKDDLQNLTNRASVTVVSKIDDVIDSILHHGSKKA
ncbi:MAG: cation:proton antiporter [Rikenellaceae bacterium]